jgi:hypothetical protein
VNSNYIPNQDSLNRVHMKIEITKKQYHWFVISAILLSALGCFVDLYDLFIFNVVRTESLTSLGVAQKDLLSVGIGILDWTFTGMVLSGVIFISEKLTGI